jgi:hypothetical protein
LGIPGRHGQVHHVDPHDIVMEEFRIGRSKGDASSDGEKWRGGDLGGRGGSVGAGRRLCSSMIPTTATNRIEIAAK